ncbi:EF-hand domain-containing protein [Rhizorhabdus sp. FW153]|uniref:EF-hand domain-containing protein n=1 Tax=Rhizorhabdus sp. FW153 TaxID=3400216 RepID=UPI003CE70210
MTRTRLIGATALVSMLVAGVAVAAPGRDGPPPPPKTRAEAQTRVTEMFKRLDTNGDGFVTKAEMDASRAKMREAFAERRDERRGEKFAKLDKDGSGSVSKDEFLAPPPPPPPGEGDGPRGRHKGMKRHHGGMMMGGGGFWFDRADANKDGKVSLAEAQSSALAMFDKVDSNRDGTISPDEQRAARDAMRAEWKAKRGERGPDAPPPPPRG